MNKGWVGRLIKLYIKNKKMATTKKTFHDIYMEELQKVAKAHQRKMIGSKVVISNNKLHNQTETLTYEFAEDKQTEIEFDTKIK